MRILPITSYLPTVKGIIENAWNREAIERLLPHLESDGFAIEMEMVTKMAKLGEKIYSMPVTYYPRVGITNLNPISDGIRILSMFTKNLHWQPFAISLPEQSRIKEV